MLSLGTLASKVFGSSNERKLKKYGPIVDEITTLLMYCPLTLAGRARVIV